MIRKLNLIGIIGISIFTAGCPQSKESLDALVELGRIKKLTVSDSENQAFANDVYVQMIEFLKMRNASRITYSHGIPDARSDKASTLECVITHHSRDTADMKCFLKHDRNLLVQAHAFRGVGMQEFGQGMYDKTPAQKLARRTIDELHKNLEMQFAAASTSSETKKDSK